MPQCLYHILMMLIPIPLAIVTGLIVESIYLKVMDITSGSSFEVRQSLYDAQRFVVFGSAIVTPIVVMLLMYSWVPTKITLTACHSSIKIVSCR